MIIQHFQCSLHRLKPLQTEASSFISSQWFKKRPLLLCMWKRKPFKTFRTWYSWLWHICLLTAKKVNEFNVSIWSFWNRYFSASSKHHKITSWNTGRRRGRKIAHKFMVRCLQGHHNGPLGTNPCGGGSGVRFAFSTLGPSIMNLPLSGVQPAR